MPVCNKCKKFSNCLTVDSCEHCGAKDWDPKTVIRFTNANDGVKRIKKFLTVLFLAILVIGGLAAYVDHEEKGRYIAVIDSFEAHETSSGYESIVKFHNTSTNYEATCVAAPGERCKRFYAGERHQFRSITGVVAFPDSSNTSLPYTETKESVR
jgi:hypothetical protein